MDTTLKGALAAGAAAVLLVGGAGTLAFWSDSETVTGTGISSGELKLGTQVCADGWQLNGTPFTTQLIVPGDTLTKSCTIDLIATGENIEADLALSTAAFAASNGLTDELDASAVFTVDGVPQTTVDETDDGGALVTDEIGVAITVDFPFGLAADNDSQDLDATLNALTLSLTQTEAP